MKLKNRLKKRLVKLKRKILMRDRFITEGFYKYGDEKKSFFRKLIYLVLLCAADVVNVADRSKASVAERQKYVVKPCVSAPESSFTKRAPLTLMSKKFLTCDIVSFDIFDTLILRPFDNPKSVFFLLGEKHKIPGFYKYRVESEKTARQKAIEATGNNEVTLYDIYSEMQRYVIIDIEYAVKLEEETEIELCMENPYMKQVFLQAKNLNKSIIAVSDMYLSKSVIVKMLEKCGYYGFLEVYISNEMSRSKRSGQMYEFLCEKYNDKHILHIGDNYYADCLSAVKYGLETKWYNGVNKRGNSHRAANMTSLIGSAYRGIVNAKLQNGLESYTQYYEFGYTYAGFLALGYCNYIHNFVKEHSVEKVLFLSRDGYILKKIYERMFPSESTEYAYWSRSAAIKASAGKFRNELLLRYIKYKIPRKMALSQILSAMNLEKMTQPLENAGIGCDEIVSKDNYDDIVRVFCDNWDIVLEEFELGSAAAKKYYTELLYNCKSACIVDIGWAASGYSTLRYLIEDEWNLDCKTYGLLAGSTYLHDMDIIEPQLAAGSIDSYMFSQRINRDIHAEHNVKRMYGAFTEIMLSAPTASFLGFSFDENGDVQYNFDLPETEGYNQIGEIHDGITDFADDYINAFRNYPFMLNICGADAYAVCRQVISCPEYFKRLFSNYPVNRAVGSDSFEFDTLAQLIENEYVK